MIVSCSRKKNIKRIKSQDKNLEIVLNFELCILLYLYYFYQL